MNFLYPICVLVITALNVLHGFSEVTQVINTTYGPVQGKTTHNGRVRQFLSIPYAAPPLEDLRWKHPQLHDPWSHVYNATQEPWGCPQICGSSGIKDLCPPYTKEDCLILSIFTPNPIANNNIKYNINNNDSYDTNHSNVELYPIMIYFFGGGWMENYGGGTRLNASNVVNFTQSAIIVLVNYRLGALGMLYDEDLGLYGNFGHFDQLFAINWIYNNSIYFGGNKDNIIIYGQSSGANSGLLHLIANYSNNVIQTINSGKNYPLIKGIICESSASGQRWRTDSEWKDISEQFTVLLDCLPEKLNYNSTKRLECLKARLVDEIVLTQEIIVQTGQKYNDMIVWSMSLKNDIFYDQPLIAVKDGVYNRDISVIIGVMECESCGDYNLQQFLGKYEFLHHWRSLYGVNITDKMIDYYNIPINNDSYNFANYSIKIHSDSMQRCSNRNILKNLKYNENRYFYHFNYSSFHINEKLYQSNNRCWYFPCHTAELWWVFNDDLQFLINDTWNSDELVLRNQFMSFWTNFAFGNNDPNVGNNTQFVQNVKWQRFTVNESNTMIFDIDDAIGTKQHVDDDPCDFYDQVLGYQWLYHPIADDSDEQELAVRS